MSAIPSKRPAPVNIAQQIAEARKRAEQVKARLEAEKAGKNGTTASTSSPGAQTNGANKTQSVAQSARERVEALKARVAAATMRTQAATPPLRPLAQATPAFPNMEFDDFSRSNGAGAARGGLAVGIHPALLGDIQDRGKSSQKPKTKNQSRMEEAHKSNPYLSETPTAVRAKRTLNFTHNLHARPAMQAANEMRRKAALDQMKKRIQASAAKAGLDESADIQAFAVAVPPEVEFWDEGLQSGIEGNEIISRLVVHPILIEPPQEKFITLKPQTLKLTKKEQKKVRRIRRKEEHGEEQAKIRLGLGKCPHNPVVSLILLTLHIVPTPAPKVSHSNVMRVYGELAVKDPTAVEAMVNKQVAERKETHIVTNAERQLTKEQRAEKIAQKAKENAALGLNMCVFRIALGKEKLLGKHRYKIDLNAKQHLDLTGVVIVAPNMSLCVVEGGEHSIRKYKHLMLNRISWQAILGGEGAGEAQSNDQDPEDNKDGTCTLLWQGQIRDRKFKKWGSFREVETEVQAKTALTKVKMENFWTLAKSSN
jgi:U4/U6 small nuclear ribonucleoprotein PRP3